MRKWTNAGNNAIFWNIAFKVTAQKRICVLIIRFAAPSLFEVIWAERRGRIEDTKTNKKNQLIVSGLYVCLACCYCLMYFKNLANTSIHYSLVISYNITPFLQMPIEAAHKLMHIILFCTPLEKARFRMC